MRELYAQTQSAAEYISSRWPHRPQAGIILGTGLVALRVKSRTQPSSITKKFPIFHSRPRSVTQVGSYVALCMECMSWPWKVVFISTRAIRFSR